MRTGNSSRWFTGCFVDILLITRESKIGCTFFANAHIKLNIYYTYDELNSTIDVVSIVWIELFFLVVIYFEFLCIIFLIKYNNLKSANAHAWRTIIFWAGSILYIDELSHCQNSDHESPNLDLVFIEIKRKFVLGLRNLDSDFPKAKQPKSNTKQLNVVSEFVTSSACRGKIPRGEWRAGVGDPFNGRTGRLLQEYLC